MAQQTAIEFVLQYLHNIKPNEFCSIEKIKELLEQAKAMEKDQIENAYKNGLAGMLPEGVDKMTITRILE